VPIFNPQTDHGLLNGLADDDHTQYLRADGTRALSANWDVGAFDVRAATITPDGLTSGRVVHATTNGRLTDNSGFTFSSPTLTIPGQIAFPATQAASGGANTLDDYEEGSWTPTIEGNTSASGQTYGTQNGRYVKIGKMVKLGFKALLTVKGTLSGYIVVKGLPFTSASTGTDIFRAPIFFEGMATNMVHAIGVVVAASASIALYYTVTAAAAPTLMQPADVGNATGFSGSVTYEASA